MPRCSSVTASATYNDQHRHGRTADSSPAWMINYLPVILWQRRYYVLACFLAMLALGVVAAFGLPRTYRSTATLLVQSQDLPTTIVEFADERCGRAAHRPHSRAGAEPRRPHPADRAERPLSDASAAAQPLSKIIEKMRHATNVGALSSDIGQQSGTQNNTIAIAMSFDYPDPGKAQAVLQSFVSKFLTMDSQDVEDQATLTVRFLQDQANKLQSQISDIEGQLTALKARNGAALASSGMPPLLDTGSFSAQIAALAERKPPAARAEPRAAVMAMTHLSSAEAALAAAQAQYSDSHPDVIAAKERVKQLRQMAKSATPDTDASRSRLPRNNAAIHQLMEQRDATMARANAAIAGSGACAGDHGTGDAARKSRDDAAHPVSADLREPAQGAEQRADGDRAARRAPVAGRAGEPCPTSPFRRTVRC